MTSLHECQPQMDDEAKPSYPNINRNTVLVVDDDTTVLEITTMMLDRLGYETLKAESLENTLVLFKLHYEKISFVITDLELSDTYGQTLCYAIKEIEESAKVVLATGGDMGAVSAADNDKQFDGFLQKPFSIKQLQRIVESFN